MKTRRTTGIGLIALGMGMIASALLGPLVLSVIEFRVSDNMDSQLIGGEIISLLVGAPIAVVAGILWLRGHWLAPVLALGPALYAVYTYVQFVAGPEYARYDGNNENAFPLYLVLIIFGWVIAARAWTALATVNLSPPPTVLRRALAGLLIVLNVFIALAWVGTVVDALDGGAVAREYREDTTLFWLIRLMDLAFVVPAALVTGVGLLCRTPWATRLGYVFAPFQTLLVGAVASMAITMTARDDPSANPVLLAVTAIGTLALAITTVLLLRGAEETATRGPDRTPHPTRDSRRTSFLSA